jgi:hypothetical protein
MARKKPAQSDTDTTNDDRLLIVKTLREIMAGDGPDAAKAQAARTLGEMVGLLGKHQDRPDNMDSRPLAGLSRADLARELARLQGLGD